MYSTLCKFVENVESVENKGYVRGLQIVRTSTYQYFWEDWEDWEDWGILGHFGATGRKKPGLVIRANLKTTETENAQGYDEGLV